MTPALVLLLAFCLGGLQGVVLQVRLQDSVADAARLVARGEGESLAVERVRTAVPGATLNLTRPERLVCADASAPLALGGRELPVRVDARSCALGGGR